MDFKINQIHLIFRINLAVGKELRQKIRLMNFRKGIHWALGFKERSGLRISFAP